MVFLVGKVTGLQQVVECHVHLLKVAADVAIYKGATN